MTNNALQDIISRCHQRHEEPLKQRRSIVEPLLYKGHHYHFTVYCVHKYPVMLQDLEAADISFMPIGQFPGNDRPPRSFGGERFLKRQQAKDWETLRWHKSGGIQIYTGMPSARDDAPWHDIDFKYEALCAAPDVVLTCIQALVDAVANPLLTISKSGGLRFSCRIPGYLHPNMKQARLYIHCSGLLIRGLARLDLFPMQIPEKDSEIESILRNSGAICLNLPDAEFTAKTEAKILKDHRLFLDPQYEKIAEQMLEQRDGTQQLCIINVTREDELFLECEISKRTLENWVVNWKDSALGNFATALLNALGIKDKSPDYAIRRIRTVIQTYEWLEEEIIQQMIGLPFYNEQNENPFWDALNAALTTV